MTVKSPRKQFAYLISIDNQAPVASIDYQLPPQCNFDWEPLKKYLTRADIEMPKTEYYDYKIYSVGTSHIDIVEFTAGQFIVAPHVKEQLEKHYVKGVSYFPIEINGKKWFFIICNHFIHCLDYEASFVSVPEDHPESKTAPKKIVFNSELLLPDCIFRIPEIPSALFCTSDVETILLDEEFTGFRLSQVELLT